MRRSESERAIDLAYRAVARRDLTVAELQFAEDKREIDQWGTDRIAMDLRRRGIPPQLIDAALVTHDRDSEMRTALLLLRQRYPTAPRDDRERDRAWQMLVRRGYSPDLSYDAIRTWERTERERRRAA